MRRSQGLPHSFYLFLADLEVVPVPREDFDRHRIVILSLLELLQYPFEIDDPCTNREVIVLLPKIVICMDMADAMTITPDELRGFVSTPTEICMADIQSEAGFRKGLEDGLEFRRLRKKVGLGKHVLKTEGQA